LGLRRSFERADESRENSGTDPEVWFSADHADPFWL
jgi:hypothetical protein